jgi:hypothetical protein
MFSDKLQFLRYQCLKKRQCIQKKLGIADWSKVSRDAKMKATRLKRLTHRCDIVEKVMIGLVTIFIGLQAGLI